MSTTPKPVVRDYYESLRGGRPLEPYFLPAESTVKIGISEQLYGYDDVAGALAEQTASTDNWTVESTALTVTTHGEYATVADEVTMAWTNTDSGERHRFETRWSGTLVRALDEAATESVSVSENESDGDNDSDRADEDVDRPAWLFRTMHVSVAHEL